MSALTTSEITALFADIPDYDGFLSVDDLLAASQALAADHPSKVGWTRIGTSRLGEPIHKLTVGDGDLNAVVFAAIHPNEPIGSLTTLHLARTLAEDESLARRLGYTWHIVPCIDPDGMRLNEGWFQGTITRERYGRNFYRPAADEQVEWTFPFAYKDAYFDRTIPEAFALMRLIDDTRPTFMCPLHNSELGGVYYYLSEPSPDLYQTLTAIPEFFGIPLDRGEPEAPFIRELAPGIYGDINMKDEYDYVASLGMDPVEAIHAGESSGAYASKYGTFLLVSELPYWTHPDASDPTPTDRSYGDVIRQRGQRIGELAEVLNSVLATTADELTIQSPFLRATRRFGPSFALTSEQDLLRADQPESDRPATVAEVFSSADQVHMFRLRFAGMLVRALQAEVDAGLGRPKVRSELSRLRDVYEGWCQEAAAATPAETVALRSLVGVQYGAIVAAADHAARGTRGERRESEPVTSS